MCRIIWSIIDFDWQFFIINIQILSASRKSAQLCGLITHQMKKKKIRKITQNLSLGLNGEHTDSCILHAYSPFDLSDSI